MLLLQSSYFSSQFSRRPSQKGRSIPPSIIGRRHKSTASASVSEAEIAQIRQRTRSFATAQPSWVGRRRTAPPSAESELSQFNPFWDAESTGSTTSLSESMKLSNLNMRHVGALQTPTFDSVPVFMNASEVEIVDPFRRAPPMDRGVPNSFFMSLP